MSANKGSKIHSLHGYLVDHSVSLFNRQYPSEASTLLILNYKQHAPNVKSVLIFSQPAPTSSTPLKNLPPCQLGCT